MARVHEVEEVAEPNRHRWLAAQIDELDSKFTVALNELNVGVHELTKELRTTRADMTKSSMRIVWTVLTASITLLVSVVGVVLSGVLK